MPDETNALASAGKSSQPASQPAPKEVLYRKYRFSSFADMCGQQQVASFFINTIKYNKVSHAYLFSGPRGTGKTSMARLFAKILNCTGKTTYEPCGKCHNCLEFEKGSAVDIIEMDAASNRKIDDIRSLRDDVAFMPVVGKYKIFILDEAHMLTTEAANAFLKTLEEPPPYVIFILATTEHHKIPATILSRCQLVKFTRIAVADIVARLEHVVKEENIIRSDAEKISYEREALFLIAKKAAGGMRDALSLLEYVIALAHGDNISGEMIERILGVHSVKIIKNFIESIFESKPERGLEIIARVYSLGNELVSFIETLNSYLTSLVLVKIGVAEASFLDCDADDFRDISDAAAKIDKAYLYKILEIFSECLSGIRYAPNPRSYLEFCYVKSFAAKFDKTSAIEAQPSAAPAVFPSRLEIEKIIDEKIAALKISKPLAAASSDASAQRQGSSPGAPAAAVIPPSKLSAEKIKLIWSSTFLNQLKQISIPTHAIISSGVLSKYSDGVLELDFTKNAFCGERMMAANHLKLAEEAFLQTYGAPVKIKIILPAQDKNARSEQRKKEILEEKKNDPMVQKILQEFDGEIIDVEEH